MPQLMMGALKIGHILLVVYTTDLEKLPGTPCSDTFVLGDENNEISAELIIAAGTMLFQPV